MNSKKELLLVFCNCKKILKFLSMLSLNIRILMIASLSLVANLVYALEDSAQRGLKGGIDISSYINFDNFTSNNEIYYDSINAILKGGKDDADKSVANIVLYINKSEGEAQIKCRNGGEPAAKISNKNWNFGASTEIFGDWGLDLDSLPGYISVEDSGRINEYKNDDTVKSSETANDNKYKISRFVCWEHTAERGLANGIDISNNVDFENFTSNNEIYIDSSKGILREGKAQADSSTASVVLYINKAEGEAQMKCLSGGMPAALMNEKIWNFGANNDDSESFGDWGLFTNSLAGFIVLKNNASIFEMNNATASSPTHIANSGTNEYSRFACW